MQTRLWVIDSYYPVDQTIERRLAVAVDVHDPDGGDEMALLRVGLPAQRLLWEHSVAQLRAYEEEGQHWFVSDDMLLPTIAGPLPIEILVEDKTLQRATATTTLPSSPPANAGDAFPRMVPTMEGAAIVPGGDRYSTAVPTAGTWLVPEGTEALFVVVAENGGQSAEPLEVATAGETEAPLAAAVAEQIGGRRFYLIIRHTRTQWRESGPWTLATLP